MKWGSLLAAVSVALFLAAAPALAAPPTLATVVEWMSGSFSNQQQAAADSAFFDIRLEMAPIWTGRDDGAWLYVEQAVGSALERPYRQRVYRVTQIETDLFKSEVYTFPEPLAHAGAWQHESPLADLSPDDLELRAGCAVFLRWAEPGEFMGSTIGRGCGSTLRGAAYATSEVQVTPDRITSWDRGYDQHGEQVWGAEKGPYIFLRSDRQSAAAVD